MPPGRFAAHAAIALAALSACGGPQGVSPAEASPPPAVWQNVERVQILCLATSERGVDPDLQARLCEMVRGLAAEGAPMPVAVIPTGDPAVLAPGAVTLLVHASQRPVREGRLLAFSIRPFRAADQDAVLFGAAPRAVLLPDGGATDALGDAIGEALSETLPWRSKPRGPQPIGR